MSKPALFLAVVVLFTMNTATAQTYPQIKGYGSVLHPLVTFDRSGSTTNFTEAYAVAIPFGINLLKSDRIGYSFEIAPTIKVENGVDKVSYLVFHPGVIVRYPNGVNVITRLAFETTGRYGVTPVLNKVVAKRTGVSYFAAVPMPVRFGNGKPTSIGIAFQVGAVF